MELKQHCEGECLSTSPSAMHNNKFLATNDTNFHKLRQPKRLIDYHKVEKRGHKVHKVRR